MRYSLKKDSFRKARGGYARLLNISCRKCKHFLFVYQKDGPGNLRRLYLDRVSPSLSQKSKVLHCAHCNEILGDLIVYHKEKRKAYRLYQDAVIKKVRRLS